MPRRTAKGAGAGKCDQERVATVSNGGDPRAEAEWDYWAQTVTLELPLLWKPSVAMIW